MKEARKGAWKRDLSQRTVSLRPISIRHLLTLDARTLVRLLAERDCQMPTRINTPYIIGVLVYSSRQQTANNVHNSCQ